MTASRSVRRLAAVLSLLLLAGSPVRLTKRAAATSPSPDAAVPPRYRIADLDTSPHRPWYASIETALAAMAAIFFGVRGGASIHVTDGGTDVQVGASSNGNGSR